MTHNEFPLQYYTYSYPGRICPRKTIELDVWIPLSAINATKQYTVNDTTYDI